MQQKDINKYKQKLGWKPITIIEGMLKNKNGGKSPIARRQHEKETEESLGRGCSKIFASCMQKMLPGTEPWVFRGWMYLKGLIRGQDKGKFPSFYIHLLLYLIKFITSAFTRPTKVPNKLKQI